jgi:hypothetical protein
MTHEKYTELVGRCIGQRDAGPHQWGSMSNVTNVALDPIHLRFAIYDLRAVKILSADCGVSQVKEKKSEKE